MQQDAFEVDPEEGMPRRAQSGGSAALSDEDGGSIRSREPSAG